MSLRPTALALGSVGDNGMYVVIDDPESSGPLLIPCSWEHRRTDVSREDLAEDFELYQARGVEMIERIEAEVARLGNEISTLEGHVQQMPVLAGRFGPTIELHKQIRDRLQGLLDEAKGTVSELDLIGLSGSE